MFPVIDKQKTGIKLRRIMDQRGLTVKDVQQYLNLGSVQSIYHWLNGISMPTIDNLYALSELFQMPVDDMLCGSRDQSIMNRALSQKRRMQEYYYRLQGDQAA